MLVTKLDHPNYDLSVARLHLAQHNDLSRDLGKPAVGGKRQRRRVADPPPDALPAERARLRPHRFQQRRADSAAARVGVHAHHSERAAGDAGWPDEREAAALVQEAPAVAARRLLGGEDAIGLDRVVDLGAALEVRARLGGADHPDRFSFPCFFAYRSPVRKVNRPSGTETAPITSSAQISVPKSVNPAPSRIAARQPRSA